MNTKFILLSTYDPSGSKNLGDHLLTASAEKLLKSEYPDATIVTYYREMDLTDKLDELNEADAIILPGFALRKNTYPETYRLVEDLDKLKTPIRPLGCGTKFNMLDKEKVIDQNTLSFVRRLEQHSPIPCRELITRQVLKGYGIKTGVSGDLGMFDPDFFGKEISLTETPKKVVFTTPHNPIYLEQAKSVMDAIQALFPDAEKFVSFQSSFAHGNHPQEVGISDYGVKLGFTILHPDLKEGDLDPLNIYEEADLHVGYRCHGHLYFLRTRKPSVLISEDSRGVGFSEIHGLPVFSAFDKKAKTHGVLGGFFYKVLNKLGIPSSKVVNRNLASEIKLFLEEELETNFLRYKGIGQKIDTLYEQGMKKFIKNLL